MKYKRIKTITAITAALGLLTAFGIFRNATPVQAQDTRPNDTTHLGVPERNVVNLYAQNRDYFHKVERHGVTDTSGYYSVPAGKVFVVTDIQTELYGNAGRGVIVFVSIGNISRSFDRTIFRMSDKIDSNGLGRPVVHFSGGLMIGEGEVLRLEPRAYPSGNTGNNITAESRIEGYEVDASPGI